MGALPRWSDVNAPTLSRLGGSRPGAEPGLLVLLAQERVLTHADGLQVLAQDLVEVVGHLLGGPAALMPHAGNLPRRLEEGVGESGAAQDLPVHVGGVFGGQEGDER